MPFSSPGKGPGRERSSGSIPEHDDGLLPEQRFLKTLRLERKRAGRSGRSFVLALLKFPKLLQGPQQSDAFREVARTLSEQTREIGVKGWYKESETIGVIFTEIGADADARAVAASLLDKITRAISQALGIDQINRIALSFHVFPDHWEERGHGNPADLALYPDDAERTDKGAHVVKRVMDIAGSLFALILFAPVVLIIAALIKLTSKGPVLFKQERLGFRGNPFRLLKFRSMYVQNDSTAHQEYVKRFIAGKACPADELTSGAKVYKLEKDPRVTPLGRFLRSTSLDEFPQFLNVLKGEMSLVGPRPPIRYEVARYAVWHRERLFAARPGITGLWQVEGRSRVTFEEMVRLDLKYAADWSIWLDIKILLRTPRAVVMGAH